MKGSHSTSLSPPFTSFHLSFMSRQLEVILTCKSQHLADVVPLPALPTAAQAISDATILIHHHQQPLGAVLTAEQEDLIRNDAQMLYDTRCKVYHSHVTAAADRGACDGRITRIVEVHPDSGYTDEQLRILATLDAVIAMNCYHGPDYLGELNTTLYARANKVYRIADGTGDYYTLMGDRLRYIANDFELGQDVDDRIEVDHHDEENIHAEFWVQVIDEQRGIYALQGSTGGELITDPEEEQESPYRLRLWFKNGQLGREDDLPAVEDANVQMWFTENRCHREGQPAIVYSKDDVVYCLEGVEQLDPTEDVGDEVDDEI